MRSPFLLLARRRGSRRGQTLVEYALIVCVVSIVFFLVFFLLIGTVGNLFSHIIDILDTAQVFSSAPAS